MLYSSIHEAENLNYELTDIPLKFAKVNVEEQDGMETVRRLILSHLDKFPPGFVPSGS